MRNQKRDSETNILWDLQKADKGSFEALAETILQLEPISFYHLKKNLAKYACQCLKKATK